jgi:hypothetical protein
MNLNQMYESQEPTVLQAQKLVPLEWAERIRTGYEKGAKSLPLLARTKELIETKLQRNMEAEEFMLMITILTSTADPDFVKQCVEEEMKEKDHDLYGVSERVWYRVVRKICNDI